MQTGLKNKIHMKSMVNNYVWVKPYYISESPLHSNMHDGFVKEIVIERLLSYFNKNLNIV